MAGHPFIPYRGTDYKITQEKINEQHMVHMEPSIAGHFCGVFHRRLPRIHDWLNEHKE